MVQHGGWKLYLVSLQQAKSMKKLVKRKYIRKIKERKFMSDSDLQTAIVAALQPVAQQAAKAINYSFAPEVPPTPSEVTGTVNPQ